MNNLSRSDEEALLAEADYYEQRILNGDTTQNNTDRDEQQQITWDYCPSCSGELDTGYECTKCGRDWQSYVHEAALRIETETEQ